MVRAVSRGGVAVASGQGPVVAGSRIGSALWGPTLRASTLLTNQRRVPSVAAKALGARLVEGGG